MKNMVFVFLLFLIIASISSCGDNKTKEKLLGTSVLTTSGETTNGVFPENTKATTAIKNTLLEIYPAIMDAISTTLSGSASLQISHNNESAQASKISRDINITESMLGGTYTVIGNVTAYFSDDFKEVESGTLTVSGYLTIEFSNISMVIDNETYILDGNGTGIQTNSGTFSDKGRVCHTNYTIKFSGTVEVVSSTGLTDSLFDESFSMKGTGQTFGESVSGSWKGVIAGQPVSGWIDENGFH